MKARKENLVLDSKVVIVTGAAGLIGRAFVGAIIDNGGIPVIADANLDAANELAARHDRPELACVVDITHAESLADCFAKTKSQFGRVDGIVNSAYPRNAHYGRHVEDVEYADFCENISLHLGGYFLVMQTAAKVFAKQGHGRIVNISSIYGMMAPRFQIYNDTKMTTPVEYAAIKSGVLHLTRYFAQYYKLFGVRVNAISPGGILDGQPESFLNSYRRFAGTRGMLDANDICGALLFLLSDHSEFVTGQNIVVDDGFSL